MAAKRELIYINGEPAYVRRDSDGKFAEVDMVKRSLPADTRQPARRTVPPGQGDKGDQKRRKRK